MSDQRWSDEFVAGLGRDLIAAQEALEVMTADRDRLARNHAACWRERSAREAAQAKVSRLEAELDTLDAFTSDAETRLADAEAKLETLRKQQWSNQNRAEVAERGHKACLARNEDLSGRLEAAELERDQFKEIARGQREEIDLLNAALERALERNPGISEKALLNPKVCGFCKGKPVGNAASWLDGKPRPPAPCPRCGEVNYPSDEREAGNTYDPQDGGW